MTVVRLPRLTWSRVPLLFVAAVLGAGCVVLGVATLPTGWLDPLPDSFGTYELLGWCVVALVTGGAAFGGRTRHPPLLAGGLVGSAALLGADPVATAIIAAVGVFGGLRRTRLRFGVRLLAAVVAAWSIPGVLALAAAEGRGTFGTVPIPVASVVALWAVLAVAVPLLESLGTRLVLPPEGRVDPMHMLIRRFEPQTVLTALAVLAAITYLAIDEAAVLVVLLPAAAARVGFAKHEEGRRAVAQTLAAMTVLPEWVGIMDVGHTERVRDVVERVAIDLALESRVRQDVVRAAELHELGHLDGGVVSGDRGRIARSGAAVLEQAGMQGRVVRIIDATDPDRALGSPDADVELGAAIVAAACELDRMGPIPDAAEAVNRVKAALGRTHRPTAPFF